MKFVIFLIFAILLVTVESKPAHEMAPSESYVSEGSGSAYDYYEYYDYGCFYYEYYDDVSSGPSSPSDAGYSKK